ncbi:6317_t:CDS:2, partial [Paraglomus brasilianum]
PLPSPVFIEDVEFEGGQKALRLYIERAEALGVVDLTSAFVVGSNHSAIVRQVSPFNIRISVYRQKQ